MVDIVAPVSRRPGYTWPPMPSGTIGGGPSTADALAPVTGPSSQVPPSFNDWTGAAPYFSPLLPGLT